MLPSPKTSPYWLALLPILIFCTACQPDDAPPNVLLINIDDMGWRDLGVTGSGYYETPHIDSLVRAGLRFTDAYAGAANCAPSRACLMTGRWPTRHGVYTVGSSERGKSHARRLVPVKNTVHPDSSFELLPELLSKHGYRTCHAGKWHLSKDPLKDGFDVNIGGGANGHPRSYYPPYKNVDLEPGENDYLTDLIMEKVIDFVQRTEAPFFLYYAPYAVHTPIQAVEALLPKYEQRPADGGQNNAAYATMIENLDRNVGLLLRALRETGKDDNLLIVLTSDNGGLYGITEQHPLRAGKGAYYEGGIRIPMALTWTGRVPAGEVSALPVTHLDLYPTVLAAAGIDYASGDYDGRSLWPLPAATDTAWRERPLYWHFPVYLQRYQRGNTENRDTLFRTRPGSVVRRGDWKLHYYFEDEGVELYNLAEDIGERRNLVTQDSARAAAMLRQLREWWRETDAPTDLKLNPEFVAVE